MDNNMVTEETKIALLYNDMGYVKKSVDSIESKLDKASELYASKAEVIEVKDTVSILQRDVEVLKRWRYYFTGVAATVGVIMAKLADIVGGSIHIK